MKGLTRPVGKRCLRFFREHRTLVILLGIHAILLMFFGFFISLETRNEEGAILDLSKDQNTRLITDQPNSSGDLRVDRVLSSYDQVDPGPGADYFSVPELMAMLMMVICALVTSLAISMDETGSGDRGSSGPEDKKTDPDRPGILIRRYGTGSVTMSS